MELNSYSREKIVYIPQMSDYSEIFFYIKNNDINYRYLNYLKDLTTFSDAIISDWLSMSVKTLRSYRLPKSTFKSNLKEQIVLLLSLYQHGNLVFEGKENFDKWLFTANIYFDNKPPLFYLDTISGIKFIDNRLTAMEFGDNV